MWVKTDWQWVNIIKQPRIQTIPDILTPAEVVKLIGATRKLRFHVFFLTTYSLGLRLEEALSLQVGDIDAHQKRVHVRRGKGNKDRLVPSADRGTVARPLAGRTSAECRIAGRPARWAGLTLTTGEIIANVEPRHRSCEFIVLLKRLDSHYPNEAIIRVVLDNHSAHISMETMSYLATRPRRFEYVHTPKHGYWLNLIECAFSKMARTFLRHIRVTSKEELKERILNGIAEINEAPVPFRWKKFDLELT